MAYAVLGLFCIGLVICLTQGWSVVLALLFGLFVFLLYGLYKQVSPRELLRACLDGVLKVRTILIVFALIGTMTALWRAAGTIPMIVVYAAGLIRPAIFPLVSFLLCCGVSFLTGSSFASAATIGVVCTTVGASMGFDPALIGGCVFSGIYFGDRCSPVSTSALLTAQVTDTVIFDNLHNMFRSAAVPFTLTAAAYGLLFRGSAADTASVVVRELFYRGYVLSSALLAPAVIILILAAFRIDVKIAMGTSIVCAAALCFLMQHMSGAELLHTVLFGYKAADSEIAAMMNGGGILSMVNVALIVGIASMYAGIFEKTGLLTGISGLIARLAAKTTEFLALLVTATVADVVACNQSLGTILAAQLCRPFYDSKEKLANDIADSAIVIPGLMPWSIACAVPLASIGAPVASIFYAYYLWLLPICGLVWSFLRKSRKGSK